MKREISAELKEDLAEITWFLVNYPSIKQRAERIEKRIVELDARPTKKKQSSV